MGSFLLRARLKYAERLFFTSATLANRMHASSDEMAITIATPYPDCQAAGGDCDIALGGQPARALARAFERNRGADAMHCPGEDRSSRWKRSSPNDWRQ